jgi:hypothetical protein
MQTSGFRYGETVALKFRISCMEAKRLKSDRPLRMNPQLVYKTLRLALEMIEAQKAAISTILQKRSYR